MSDNTPNERPEIKPLITYPVAEAFAMILAELRHSTYSIDGLVGLLLDDASKNLSDEQRKDLLKQITANTKHLRHIMNAGWDYLENHDGIQRPYGENTLEEDDLS